MTTSPPPFPRRPACEPGVLHGCVICSLPRSSLVRHAQGRVATRLRSPCLSRLAPQPATKPEEPRENAKKRVGRVQCSSSAHPPVTAQRNAAAAAAAEASERACNSLHTRPGAATTPSRSTSPFSLRLFGMRPASPVHHRYRRQRLHTPCRLPCTHLEPPTSHCTTARTTNLVPQTAPPHRPAVPLTQHTVRRPATGLPRTLIVFVRLHAHRSIAHWDMYQRTSISQTRILG